MCIRILKIMLFYLMYSVVSQTESPEIDPSMFYSFVTLYGFPKRSNNVDIEFRFGGGYSIWGCQ